MQNLPPATQSQGYATALPFAPSQPSQALAATNFAGQLALVQREAVPSAVTEPCSLSDELSPSGAFPSQSILVSPPWGTSGTDAWFGQGPVSEQMTAAEASPLAMMIAAPGVPALSEGEAAEDSTTIANLLPPQVPGAVTPGSDSAPIAPTTPSPSPVPSQSPARASPRMPSAVEPAAVLDGPPQPSVGPLADVSTTPMAQIGGWDDAEERSPDGQRDPDNPSPNALLQAIRTDPEGAGQAVALAVSPEVTASSPDASVASGSTARRHSAGRPDAVEPEREDPSPVAVVPMTAPQPQTVVPFVPEQGAGDLQPEPALAKAPASDASPPSLDSGGASPGPGGGMLPEPSVARSDVRGDTVGRGNIEPALHPDQPGASADPIAPSQSPSPPLEGASLRPEAPAAVATAARGQTSVTEQIAPAMVVMGQAHDGAHRMTLRLNPIELGLVEIRIDRPADAPARVQILVERPETLTLLLRDQTQLERALDQAGLPPDGRSLSIQVGPVAPPVPSGDPPDLAGHGGAGAPFADGSAGSQDGTRRQDRPSFGSHGPDGTQGESGTIPVRPRWLRAGLDITA